MGSKKEYSDAINKLLGLEIDWTKLTQEDLIQFATLLNNPKVFIEKLGADQEVQEYVVGGVFREIAAGALESFDGPIARILKGGIAKKK